MVKISACVITKNEEKNINSWLAGIRDLADEWIVVDTGSTDRTVELAKAGGARVFRFSWCDDFSAAKNFALEQAKGEWILFLDADEYFSMYSIENVKNNIKRFHPQRKILGLACRLVNIDQDNQEMVIDSAVQVRIFRNLHALRYAGKIHEVLQYCKGEKTLQFQLLEDVEIYHTGYSSSIIKSKLRRNLSLLEQKIYKQGKEQPEDYHYLMDCYFGLAEYEKAEFYAKKAIKTNIRMVGIEGKAYITLVKCMIFLKRPADRILSVIEKSLKQYAGVADFFFLKAYVLWNQRDYLAVQTSTIRGIELWQSECKGRELGQNGSSGRLAATGYFYLGKIQWLQFRRKQALEYFLDGLKLAPRDAALLGAVYDCIAELPPTDIIQFLNVFYSCECDIAFLVNILKQKNAGTVYLYYRNRINQEKILDRAGVYEASSRYDAAVVQLTDEINWISRLGVWSAVRQDLFPEQTDLALLLPQKSIVEWKKALGVQMSTESQGITPDKTIAEAVHLFSAGRTSESIDLLKTALEKSPGQATLTYGLASLLQLVNQKKAAREVLLQGKHLFAEARTLWRELKNDANSPLVSIMIPTYNRPELFEQTLQSARAQTYSNIEILVCDNSTNDATEKIMEKYKDDLRITYQRNLSANTKAENFQPFEILAQGEYLQWLMDDDILQPEKITKMIRCFQENPTVTLVTSERGAIDGKGRVLPKPYPGYVEIQGEYSIYPGELIQKLLLMNRANFLGEPSAVLFRRKQLQHHYWRAECRGYQTISDIVMWLELLEQGDCAIFKDALSFYRKHDAQEGGQPDTILLSRIEWSRLLHEQYGLEHLTECEYLQGRLALCQEQVIFRNTGLDKLASEGCWHQYIKCMNQIGKISFS